jgi:mycothione reductase
MKKYDVIVIGSGCGMIIANEALIHHLKVALVDKGPLGGTCANLGCIPSKMLIYAADRVVEAAESSRIGIKTTVENVDFHSIMERMRKFVRTNQEQMRQNLTDIEGLDYYQGEGHFVSEYTLEVNGERIQGDKIFIASGSRPVIPPVKGLDSTGYLTNESLLALQTRPDSLVIMGGGYVAVEYGHFFAAMGTKVTMLEMADRLVLSEEPEIAALLAEELRERMAVHTGSGVQEVRNDASGIIVNTSDKAEYRAQSLLVAVGRRSNADLLKVENTGVEVDARGWIKVNEFLETTKKNIYAVGDANGTQMFTHVANLEASLAADAAVHGTRLKIDYSAAPHAVYSYPQIASVGLKEEEARKHHKIRVGRASYFDVAQGEAMNEKKGFAKAIIEDKTNKLLGFHIIGPFAPILIQEVIDAMTAGGNMNYVRQSLHIHPSITELIPHVLAETD